MKPALVMAAFGTTSRARSTYQLLDRDIRTRFPAYRLEWAYTSRMVRDSLEKRGRLPCEHPHQVLRRLAQEGYRWAVVQSLHLTAGHEFYRLVEEVRGEPIRTAIGLPLLHSFADHQRLADGLVPLAEDHPDKALVLVGHGTDHPAWTSYPALQMVLQQRFGPRVLVGCLEGWPAVEQVTAAITSLGLQRALLVPLMLVAGVHFQEDLAGDAADSWKNRLQAAGIETTALARGLGELSTVREIFADHLAVALDAIPRRQEDRMQRQPKKA